MQIRARNAKVGRSVGHVTLSLSFLEQRTWATHGCNIRVQSPVLEGKKTKAAVPCARPPELLGGICFVDENFLYIPVVCSRVFGRNREAPSSLLSTIITVAEG